MCQSEKQRSFDTAQDNKCRVKLCEKLAGLDADLLKQRLLSCVLNKAVNPIDYSNLGSLLTDKKPIKQFDAGKKTISKLQTKYCLQEVFDGNFNLWPVDLTHIILDFLYAEPLRIRICRPIALGKQGDMHHLHLRQVVVLDKNGQQIPLEFYDASALVKNPKRGKEFSPEVCLEDNDKSSHSDFGPDIPDQLKTEDHWMSFAINEVRFEDIGSIIIKNTGDLNNRRFWGSEITVTDTKQVLRWKHVVKNIRNQYNFQVLSIDTM